LVGVKRLEFSIENLKTQIAGHILPEGVVEDSIRATVLEKLNRGLSSKGGTTRQEILREVRYVEIEGDKAIGDWVHEHEFLNSEKEGADPKLIGSPKHESQAVHFPSLEDARVVIRGTEEDEVDDSEATLSGFFPLIEDKVLADKAPVCDPK
jgi:hypothetical protein